MYELNLIEKKLLASIKKGDPTSLFERADEWDRETYPNLGIVCEPKVDGVGFCATYVDGELLRIVSKKGKRILHNLLPQKMEGFTKNTSVIRIRGEFYVPLDVFEELKEVYRTPRSAMIGILNSSPIKFKKYMENKTGFIVYDVEYQNPEWFSIFEEKMESFNEQVNDYDIHFPLFRHYKHEFLGPEIIYSYWRMGNYYDNIRNIVRSKSFRTFPLDGVVYKTNSIDLQRDLGYTDNNVCRWMIAKKFPPKKVDTTVLGIEWSISPKGKKTPIVQVEPVLIDNRVVSRVNMFNENMLEKSCIKQGSVVLIELSGDCIPRIVEVIRQ